MGNNLWEVVRVKRVVAKKVIAYVTVRYAGCEFRNLRILRTSQGLVALFPGYVLGRISIPYVLVLSDTLKQQLQSAIRSHEEFTTGND